MELFSKDLLDGVSMKDSITLSKHSSLKNDIMSNKSMVRPLRSDDYLKGFVELISENGEKESIKRLCDSKFLFQDYYSILSECMGMYYVVVLEDLRLKKILGAATLTVEQKFIHSASKRGRIIDVKVDQGYQRIGIGSLLLEVLTRVSYCIGCYKTTIVCPNSLQVYCENVQYHAEPNQNHLRNSKFLCMENLVASLPSSKI